jgi:hypothetical protein
MRKWIQGGSLLLIAAGLWGCASGGGASNVYRSDMGRLLVGPLLETKDRVWPQHQISVYRQQVDQSRLRIESEWIPRQPTPAEASQGVEEARNRVVIEGRRVEGAFDEAGAVYRVTFQMENQIVTNLDRSWDAAPPPQAVIDRYREVLRDMEIELRTGVRR